MTTSIDRLDGRRGVIFDVAAERGATTPALGRLWMRRLWIGLMTAMCVADSGLTLSACASTCVVSGSATSTLSSRLTLEFPSGPIDGNNQTFGLSETPIEGTEVTIYNDGEVVSSIASSLIGKDKKFALTSAPPPGIVLLASYCKAAQAPADAGVNYPVTMSSMARQALLEAMVRSSPVTHDSVLTNPRRNSREVLAPNSTSATRNNKAFMSLLSRTLEPHDDGGLFTTGALRRAETGLEGTGDKPLTLSYQPQARAGSTVPLDRMLQGSNDLGGTAGPWPRSLRLLQQRFIDTQDEARTFMSRRKH